MKFEKMILHNLRKVVKVLLLSFLIPPSIILSQGWTLQMWNFNGDQPFSDVFSTGPSTATVVGAFGQIFHTTDGGATWMNESPNNWDPSATYRKVFFVDDTTGWVIGIKASTEIVLSTTNGGMVWETHSLPVSVDLSDIYFVSKTNGTVVGKSGTILNTTDGGVTWLPKSSRISFNLNGVVFTNPLTGIIVSDSSILKTTDGGATWLTKWIHNGIVSYLDAVSFYDALRGIAGGKGCLSTTDGGETWTPDGPNGNVRHLCCPTANVALAINDSSIIVRTTNSGTTWLREFIDPKYNLYSFSFTSVTDGFAAGLQGIFHTSNGGLPYYLPQPTLKSASYDSCIRSTFTWYSDPDIQTDHYRVQVITNFFQDFVNDSIVTDTSEFITSLTRNTGFNWRVKAYGTIADSSAESDWSSVGTLYTGLLAVPLVSPQNNVETFTDSVVFSWNYVPDGCRERYRFQISLDPYFLGQFFVDDSTLMDTFKIVNGLTYGSHYYWRVKGRALQDGIIIESNSWSTRQFTAMSHYGMNRIKGSVYEDRNENGQRDSFELGFSQWRVRLTGLLTDSTLTDSLGNFEFNNIGEGAFEVSVVTQPPWEQILPRFGGANGIYFSQNGGDTSKADFAMEKVPVRVKLGMTVRDSTSFLQRVIWWGVRPGATYGIWGVDPACTNVDFIEQELPVPPLLAGYFDARFINPNLTTDRFDYGSWTDMRGFYTQAQADTYAVMFQPGYISGGDYPMRFYWSKEEVQKSFSGAVTMQTPGGPTTDMKMTDSLILTDSRIWYLNVITNGPNIPPQYTQQWRIVSLPVQSQTNKVLDLFPTSLTQAFSYLASSGYSMNNSMSPGVGYWLRMIYAIDSGQVRGTAIAEDTIILTSGWNLVGGIGVSLAVSDIESIPEGILSNHIFGYGNGYYITDSVRPYNGYWVKAGEDGRVVLKSSNTSHTRKNAAMVGPSPDIDKMNVIKLTDYDGSCRKLYFATADSQQTMDKEMFEMPPLPPEGIYDARYGTNRMVEEVTAGSMKEVPVRISSASYPVTVAWEMKEQSMAASLLIGKTEHRVKGTGEIKISSNDGDLKLRITGSAGLPKEYKLYQNYPNPFNPETHIIYTLPQSSHVSLNVYNILGQLVATVVDEKEEGGRYDVVWNAAPFTSGVYFYRLEAGSFRQTKKMLLMR